MCGLLVVRAFQRLGFAPGEGERVKAASLASRLGVAPAHHRLLGRLVAILAEDGWLRRAGEELVVERSWSGVADPLPLLARLAVEHPAAEAEVELTSRCAAELAEALRGEREPMQLLFPGGSLATAERLYRDSPTARFWNGLAAEVLAQAAPSGRGGAGRPIRILEVGAGTGGTTAHVLPRLAEAGVEYTFTDVGPLFVARARERFGPSHPGMRFEVLDLERDPEAQGFAREAYDVVVAANVVHATADLAATLARLRSLIAPGGLLALLEVTSPQRWFDLTVGLTGGWWAFTDLALRPDYPTLSRDGWLGLLAATGFEGAVALPGDDGRGGRSRLRRSSSPGRFVERRLRVAAGRWSPIVRAPAPRWRGASSHGETRPWCASPTR